jgi:hypothetical protein
LIADNFFGVINIKRDVNIVKVFMFFWFVKFLLDFFDWFRLLFLWFSIHVNNAKLKWYIVDD